MLVCDTVVTLGQLHTMTSSNREDSYTEQLSATSSIKLRWRKATDGNVTTCGLCIEKIVLNNDVLPLGGRRTMITLECTDNDILIDNFYGWPFDDKDELAQESIAKVLKKNKRTRAVFGMQQIIKFVKGLGEDAAKLPIKVLDEWHSRTVDTRAIRKWVKAWQKEPSLPRVRETIDDSSDDVTKYMLARFDRLYPEQTDEQLASYIAKSENGFYGFAGFTPTDTGLMAVNSVHVIENNIAGLQCNFVDRCI